MDSSKPAPRVVISALSPEDRTRLAADPEYVAAMAAYYDSLATPRSPRKGCG